MPGELPLLVDHVPIGVLELGVKSCFVVLLTLFVAHQHAMGSAAVRHRVWVGGIVCLAILPVLGQLGPVWELPINVAQDSGGAREGSLFLSLALAIYLAVILIRGYSLCREVFRISRVTSTAARVNYDWRESMEKLEISPRVQIRTSDQINGPMTWGLIYPVILLPTSAQHWSEHDRLMVLRHEYGHIVRGDWLTQLLAQWVCILYWPLPGIRSLLDRLSLTAEQACDDRVLASGASAPDYAALLVKQSRGRNLPATLALARPTELSQRIRTLLSGAFDHSVQRTRLLLVYPLCIILALPLASVHLVAVKPEWAFYPLNLAPPIPDRVSSPNTKPIPESSPGWHRPAPPDTVERPPQRPPLDELETGIPPP